ncbi:UNVERIFIED_CONTAM: hypothetical protein Sangu_1254600 [Sesamum angustifolium]|uniref:Uncharacterized protein n=1 Tax=Sesamum angustifolium TaxID=2727405 RepID=A0AAW2NJT8_9LAMI
MYMLTEDLHSLTTVAQAMVRVGINEDYIRPCTFHQQDDEYFEPEADSFLNNDPVDSEPYEVESDPEGQNDDNPENTLLHLEVID